MQHHKMLISLGSNMPFGRALIDRAMESLASWTVCDAKSEIYPSSSGYHNQVAVLSTSRPCDTAVVLTKLLEKEMGRTPEMKALGLVPIDIDIIKFDDLLLRPAELEKDYVKIGLAQISTLH